MEKYQEILESYLRKYQEIVEESRIEHLLIDEDITPFLESFKIEQISMTEKIFYVKNIVLRNVETKTIPIFEITFNFGKSTFSLYTTLKIFLEDEYNAHTDRFYHWSTSNELSIVYTDEDCFNFYFVDKYNAVGIYSDEPVIKKRFFRDTFLQILEEINFSRFLTTIYNDFSTLPNRKFTPYRQDYLEAVEDGAIPTFSNLLLKEELELFRLYKTNKQTLLKENER